jgi:hypothetical protein
MNVQDQEDKKRELRLYPTINPYVQPRWDDPWCYRRWNPIEEYEQRMRKQLYDSVPDFAEWLSILGVEKHPYW